MEPPGRVRSPVLHPDPPKSSVGRTINSDFSPSVGLGHASVSRVGRYRDLVGFSLAQLAVGQG